MAWNEKLTALNYVLADLYPFRDESVRIVRWVFFRGSKALTCEVRVNGDRAHEVEPCEVEHTPCPEQVTPSQGCGVRTQASASA